MQVTRCEAEPRVDGLKCSPLVWGCNPTVIMVSDTHALNGSINIHSKDLQPQKEINTFLTNIGY